MKGWGFVILGRGLLLERERERERERNQREREREREKERERERERETAVPNTDCLKVHLGLQLGLGSYPDL